MNIAAVLLGVAAIIVFLAAYRRPALRWADVALGLAILTAAWIVAHVWDTPHIVHGHW